MNPRKSLAELELQGSPNIGRALKRIERERNEPPLTPAEKSETAELDGLIAAAMKACRKGQTVDGRRNPAFSNLESLVKVRDTIRRGQRPSGQKSTEELLKEAQELLQ